MFRKVHRQLLLPYLAIFAVILIVFAIAVRLFFYQSLEGKFRDSLTGLARSAASDMEFSRDHLQVKGDFSERELNQQHQGLQWFDLQGNLIAVKGQNLVNLPFAPEKVRQIETDEQRIKAITLPVVSIVSDQLIGYVRASQAPDDFERVLQDLDIGLGAGIVLALILSSIGGVVLTLKAMQPVEHSFQQLKQFTADAAHELRGPLTAINSNVAVALKYPEGMRSSDAVKFRAIASAVTQMTELTADLLLLARTERTPSADRQPVDLEKILAHLVQLNLPHAQEKQIDLKANFSDHLYLLGEPNLLNRLFANLIENALQYTLEGGTVEIRASREGYHLQVIVQDTGIGIAPEHLKQIFERFWRADQSRSYKAGSSGLGLAIAQAIAHNHGGLITVTSEVKVGSCFTVRLPV